MRIRMKKRILLLLLGGLLSSCAIAENYPPKELSSAVSITGRVVDHRKNPVKGVEVKANGFRNVLTNDKGEFALIGPAPRSNSLTVNFTAPGFINSRRVYKAATRVAGNGTTVIVWARVAGNGNTVVIWPRSGRDR